MPSRRASVSMKDVAALAGVSVGTVSNVLNSPNLVSEQTAARVQDAIDKLGWVRNESARQLRAGRSNSIGFVAMDITNPFFTDILRAVEDEVLSAGYAVQVGNSALDPAREQAQLHLFEQQRVRGALLAPIGDSSDRVGQMRRRGIPVVVLDRAGQASNVCSVSVDDVEGGRLAVDHLIGLGHRTVAVVGGPGALQQVKDRRLGAALASSGHHEHVHLRTLSTTHLDADSGVRAAEKLVALPDAERPTAVFAINDLLAIGLLQGFITGGLRVPEDVAIIGYDDIAFAAAAAVPLSAVQQPRSLLGQKAAQLLFDEINAAENDEPHEHEQVVFTPDLVVRRSTVSPALPRRIAG